MLQSKSFVKKTKQGRVQKIVSEHYLRDGIYCGAISCSACDVATERKLSADAAAILVVDTNVVLHQIDLLENTVIEGVVVLSVVLEVVKNKNPAVYNRIKALCLNKARRFYVFTNELHRDTYVKDMVGESPNYRNDRAIGVATRWYQSHLDESVKILLIAIH